LAIAIINIVHYEFWITRLAPPRPGARPGLIAVGSAGAITPGGRTAPYWFGAAPTFGTLQVVAQNNL
jgi:hypothetical protein